MKPAITVTCLVLVDRTGHFLTTKRPPGKTLEDHWEFPGGKVEPNEQIEMALRRELLEELCLEISELKPLSAVVHEYDFATINLFPLYSRCEIRPQLHLMEHTAHLWVSLEESRRLTWAPADLPILEELALIL